MPTPVPCQSIGIYRPLPVSRHYQHRARISEKQAAVSFLERHARVHPYSGRNIFRQHIMVPAYTMVLLSQKRSTENGMISGCSFILSVDDHEPHIPDVVFATDILPYPIPAPPHPSQPRPAQHSPNPAPPPTPPTPAPPRPPHFIPPPHPTPSSPSQPKPQSPKA